MAWNYEELTYPTAPICSSSSVEKREGFNTLPMLIDEDDDGNELLHPLIDLLEMGKKIEAVSVEQQWTDDRCVCCNVIVTVEGKKYGFAAWWLSPEGFKMLIRAESLNRRAINDLCDYIISYK